MLTFQNHARTEDSGDLNATAPGAALTLAFLCVMGTVIPPCFADTKSDQARAEYLIADREITLRTKRRIQG